MKELLDLISQMVSGISEMKTYTAIILLLVAIAPLCKMIVKAQKEKIKGLLIAVVISIVLVIITRILSPKLGFTIVAIVFPLYVYDLTLFREYTIKNISTKALVYGAISASMAFVLSYIVFYRMPQGGSITAASMLPLIIFSYSFGVIPGLIAGGVYGLLQLIQDPYILHPIQVILDYTLPFAMLGLAGIMKTKNIHINLIVGTVIACTGKYICHVISGVVFFSSYAGDMNPWWYSMTYSFTVYVEMVICIIIISIPNVTKIIKRISAQNKL